MSDIHRIMTESGNGHYLINDLFITDYCCWIQQIKPNLFSSLAEYCSKCLKKLEKDQMALDLKQIEKNATNLAQINSSDNETYSDESIEEEKVPEM